MHIIKPVWLTHGGTELDRPGFLCLTLSGGMQCFMRAEPNHPMKRTKFANVIALIQVNARILRFTAAMFRQTGSDWSQLLEVSLTLFALRWRSQ
jgi:hypothetical protein